MTSSSSRPVAIPISKSSQRRRDGRSRPQSESHSSDSPYLDYSSAFDSTTSTSTPLSSTVHPSAFDNSLNDDHAPGKPYKSFESLDARRKFAPSPLTMSRSSSIQSVLSPSSSTCTSPSFRLCSRALSPPREEVIANDPLRSFGDTDDDSDSDDTQLHVPISPTSVSEEPPKEFVPSKKPPRRRSSQFKSSLTASLIALKEKLPSSLPTPTLYSPPLLHSAHHVEIETRTVVRQALSSSLPIFEISDHEEPPSSAVQLQTYSVSLGPPRKPREARMNSDFLRLLALEMEMRRSGKFGSGPLIETDAHGNTGVLVSEKVRMVLPRRCDREREDVNISAFNKSRLKW